MLAALDGTTEVEVADRDIATALVDLHAAVTQVLLSGGRTVVVDVGGLDRLPASLLSALLWAHRRCAARGGAVVLRNPHGEGLDQLRRTGLGQIFRVDTGSGAR